jgi:hypothetical protein
MRLYGVVLGLKKAQGQLYLLPLHYYEENNGKFRLMPQNSGKNFKSACAEFGCSWLCEFIQ